MTNKIMYSILVGVIVIGGFFFYYTDSNLPKDLSEWQAVFLSDGQVYFGHLTESNGSFYLLANVYYLKYGSAIQQDIKSTTTTNAPNLNLIELGGEIHGPENKMYIAKDKVLFIENLKSNSSVLQGIMKNK